MNTNSFRLFFIRLHIFSTSPPPCSRCLPRLRPREISPAGSRSLSGLSTVLFTVTRPSTQAAYRFPTRAFATSSPKTVRLGGPTYNRFGQRSQRVIPIKTLIATVCFSSFLYVYNIETVEQTGRRRFNVVSHTNELEMGRQQYKQVLASVRGHILPDSHPFSRSVDRVLRRLTAAAPMEGTEWKAHVINDNSMANAFVLPGGKVFVFTGILGVCGDEDGLAAVLSHEISHVIAHHHGERLSHSLIVSSLVVLTSVMFDAANIASMILKLGFSLPNSRVQEAEADAMGLIMMANACFPPEAAIRLWTRMERIGKANIPEFLSTHPSNYNRMEALREKLREAEDIYAAKGCGYLRDQVPGFKQASGIPIMLSSYS